MRTVQIDPITRLEGHGRIDIFLDDDGRVENAYLRVPELRGFERFCVGRPVEEMPRITTRICGVCPEAHHMAAAKACDAVYHVEVPPAGKTVRLHVHLHGHRRDELCQPVDSATRLVLRSLEPLSFALPQPIEVKPPEFTELPQQLRGGRRHRPHWSTSLH